MIVLDSFGIGYAPDAELFGDAGANTLASVRKIEGVLCTLHGEAGPVPH